MQGTQGDNHTLTIHYLMMVSLPTWTKIGFPQELHNRILKFIHDHPDQGYTSVSGFVQEAARLRMEELERQRREERALEKRK
jgi:hypothetical protein